MPFIVSICPCNWLMAQLLRYSDTIGLRVDYVRLKLYVMIYVFDSLCTYVWIYLIYSYVLNLSRKILKCFSYALSCGVWINHGMSVELMVNMLDVGL